MGGILVLAVIITTFDQAQAIQDLAEIKADVKAIRDYTSKGHR